jgi:hypothetical protein
MLLPTFFHESIKLLSAAKVSGATDRPKEKEEKY